MRLQHRYYCRRHRRDAYRHCERAPVTSSRAVSIKMQRRRRANLRDAAEEDQREKNQISRSREFLICSSFLNEAFKALKRSLAEMVFQAMNVV
jgi:hypothetical protein